MSKADDVIEPDGTVSQTFLGMMRVIHGTEKAALASLAATIAAGIEAHPKTSDWTPERVAERAVRVAVAIVLKVAR